MKITNYCQIEKTEKSNNHYSGDCMNRYHVKLTLCDSYPEISYELILPKKITFHEFEKVYSKILPYHLKEFWFYHSIDFSDVFFPYKDLIERYINEGFFITALEDYKWYELSLIDVIDYEKKYPSIIKCPDDINIKDVQKELDNIIVSKNKAYDIIISCKSGKDDIKRQFYIPEKTTFDQLEEMILITFDTQPVTFDFPDETVDYYCRRKSRFHTKNREFTIETKGIIYYKHDFPILADYSGGANPFDLWWEYYPRIEKDNAQSCLDDFG